MSNARNPWASPLEQQIEAMTQAAAREQEEQVVQMMLYGQSIRTINPFDPFAPVVEKPERKKRTRKPRSEKKTKETFAQLMAASGFRKQLTLTATWQHEKELGNFEEYKAKAEPNNKRLCGVCHDPACPWSD